MTAAETFADFVVTARPDRALARIIAPAVADCFGCILAGAQSEVAHRARTAFAPLGAGDVPVFGTSVTLPAPYAAMVNAVAGHAWDLDDWEEPGNTHPTVVLLPALLAMAHLRPASGVELFEAHAVGSEIIMRLGETVTLDHYARGFHSTATLGAIGAAGAVARLIGLSRTRTTHALAISASQATGYTIQFGSNAKPLQAGFAARTGVEAVCLAASGATGWPQVIDSPRGFAGLMGMHDPERFADLSGRLGAPLALVEFGLLLKPWPSCGYTHRLITAALDLRARLHGETRKIVEIQAVMPDFHHAILPFHRPESRAEALFSAPACIAQALVAGRLTLADSASEFWTAPEVDRLIGVTKVTPEPARDLSRNYDPDQPDLMRITPSTGNVIETECAYPLGVPQNPMSQDQLAEKWHGITGRPAEHFARIIGWTGAPDISNFFREASQ